LLTYHLPCVVPKKAWSTFDGSRFFFNNTRKLGFQGVERNQVACIFSISYVGVWSRNHRDFLKTWNVIKDNVLKSFCSYGWAANSHAYPFIPVIGQDWPPEVRDDRGSFVWQIWNWKNSAWADVGTRALQSTEISQTIFLSWKIVRDFGNYHNTCSLLL